jgi:hypothetical protein
MPTPKLQGTTVAGLILNWNQTISVQQSLRTLHVGVGSGQVPSEQVPCQHGVTISSGIGVVRPDSSTQDSPGLTEAVSPIPRHPDPLMLTTLATDAARHIRRVRAVLEVIAASCR